MKVSICIATYKRQALLEQLLLSLQALTFEKIPTPDIEIIIVDNDAAASARETVTRWQSTSRWPIHYDVEQKSGVTYTRNRTIQNAADDSDLIAIIDDDEQACPAWLESLIQTKEAYQADIVGGPISPVFQSSNVPNWIEKGGFFNPPNYQTGQVLHVAFTNNVLLPAQYLKQMDQVFDERFAVGGGEDTHLFMKLHQAGLKIVWSAEAIAYESIPASRTTFQWLVRRNYWGWSIYSLVEKELYPSLKLQSIRFLKGLGLIGVGLLALLPTLVLGKHRFCQSCIRIAQGVGTLMGLLGRRTTWV